MFLLILFLFNILAVHLPVTILGDFSVLKTSQKKGLLSKIFKEFLKTQQEENKPHDLKKKRQKEP